jgi:predicted nucleotidyltransferase
MDIKLNKTLNPKLWDKDILKEEVLAKLRTIAQAFIGFLEIPNDAVKDIRLLGSSANYNYTKHSDIDLHIVVDYEKVHKTCPVVAGYLYAQKSLFNKEHDITIYGIPVELYAESHKDKTASNGIYSIKENKWLSKPSKPKLDVDDLAIKSKYEELERAINDTNSQEEAQQILDKIYQLRKAGLDEVGEFSVENIVFKKLRDNELIQKLKGQIKTSFDKKLSLKESIENESYIISLAQEIFAEYLTR